MQNLAVAVSLVGVRDRVQRYLASDDPAERTDILNDLRQVEGATADNVAKILRSMAPPLALPESARDEQAPDLYRMTLEQTGKTRGAYVVRLPAEYDPLKQYPADNHESKLFRSHL